MNRKVKYLFKKYTDKITNDKKVTRLISRMYDKLLPSVDPITDSAINHIGSQHWSVLDRFNMYHFEGCKVWPHYSVASKTNIIEETIECPNRAEFLYDRLKKHTTREIEGIVSTVGDVWHNYYHRYVDMIPKVFSLLKSDVKINDEITLFITEYFTEKDISILKLVSPKNVNVRRATSYSRLRCEKYAHLTRLSTSPKEPAKTIQV